MTLIEIFFLILLVVGIIGFLFDWLRAEDEIDYKDEWPNDLNDPGRYNPRL